ncbi:MAG: DUF3375 domain-containing protein [Spirochaetaceae bacterium]|jgi:hypothetical protein|nr:DUF3375 domain-containing protein [Spirochaetaceae bacterium]
MKDISPEYITVLFSHDPGIKLLHSRRAAEIISFFYTLFRRDHVQTIAEEEFELRLSDYIGDSPEFFEEGEQESPADSSIIVQTLAERQQRSRELIARWASERFRFIRRLRTETGTSIELSSSVERILSFVEDIEGQPFVGTESRFLDILHRLRDLAEHTTDNPEERIRQLKEQRSQLKDEIRRIQETGQAQVYSANQITERLAEISRNARDLLADFRLTEENFRKIIASLYEETGFAESGKGKILGYTLDANRKLRDSPQGQSFASFWHFLALDSGKNEINNLTTELLQRVREQGVIWTDDFLMHLKPALHGAGRKIVNTNRLLADRLNRVLARQEEENRQLIVQHIHTIKNLALRCIENPPVDAEMMSIYTKPELFFPLRRYPILPGKEKNALPMEQAEQNGIVAEAVLQRLFNQFYIDEELLLKNIEAYRKKRSVSLESGAVSQFTLSELTAEYPVRKGIAEVVGYVSLASRAVESGQAVILDSENETIRFLSIEENREMEIRLPKVLFI